MQILSKVSTCFRKGVDESILILKQEKLTLLKNLLEMGVLVFRTQKCILKNAAQITFR